MYQLTSQCRLWPAGDRKSAHSVLEMEETNQQDKCYVGLDFSTQQVLIMFIFSNV